MEQSPYTSVQKAELYATLMVLRDFKEPVNIVTDSQYAERVILQLTSLFIQVQDIIRNRLCPMYITHIWSYMDMPGPLAQGNTEIDQLLIENMLQASEFHLKKSHQ